MEKRVILLLRIIKAKKSQSHWLKELRAKFTNKRIRRSKEEMDHRVIRINHYKNLVQAPISNRMDKGIPNISILSFLHIQAHFVTNL
jgi:hypothetical protein